jgi:DNA-binding transcriptional MerR regulator
MRSYSSAEASRLAGVSYRQLDYWVRTGFIKPARDARGKGSARRWGPLEVVQLRVARQLREAGVSLQKIRRATAWLRRALPRSTAPLADLALVTDGQGIFYLSPNPGKLVDVLAGGQAVLTVPMGDMLREVDAELPRDPGTAAAAQYDLPEVVRPGESGYFVAYCPALKGCVAQGRTRQEAQSNLRRAIASYIGVMEEAAQEETRRHHRRAEAAARA